MLPRARADDTIERLCGENVSRIAAALHAYAVDNGGVFPAGENWFEVIGPYLAGEGDIAATPRSCSYAYNTALGGKSLPDLSDAENVVAVFEAQALLSHEGKCWNLTGGQEDLPDSPCHLAGDNYGFADGSHRWLPRRQLPTAGRPWAKRPDADWVRWEP
jgi:hypothetical protein